MRARVPLDVDLEDKLIYGLSPQRFGYLVVAVLLAFAGWSVLALPPPVRFAVCLPIVAVGAALAWAKPQGKALDQWIGDLVLFVVRNYHVCAGAPATTARSVVAPEPAAPTPAAVVVRHQTPEHSQFRRGELVLLINGKASLALADDAVVTVNHGPPAGAA